METQANEILERLEGHGWQLIEKISPQSAKYWWAWEFWTIRNKTNTVVLSFIIDPQSIKKKENVCAIGISREEPENRLNAESDGVLYLGSGWLDRLPDFIKRINSNH